MKRSYSVSFCIEKVVLIIKPTIKEKTLGGREGKDLNLSVHPPKKINRAEATGHHLLLIHISCTYEL